MENLENRIVDFLYQCKIKDHNKISPFNTDIADEISSETMDRLVSSIGEYPDLPPSAILSVQEEYIKDLAKSLKFVLGACRYNKFSIEKTNNLTLKTVGVELNEEEKHIAFTDPVDVLKRKIEYKNLDCFNKIIENRISSYQYSLADNPIFLAKQRGFVIAIILIENQLNKFANPIEYSANKYNYLEDFYACQKGNLKLDTQYSSYKLFSITESIELIRAYPARFYDRNTDTTIFANGIEDYTYEYLCNLYRNNKFDLALKPSSFIFMKGRYGLTKLYEHLETGAYFRDIIFDNALVTKLYNEKYDTLWINIDFQNITFEEIIQDFVVYDECVVTQVIHCEYFNSESGIFVNHLDHEFIFYAVDEFEIRQSDPKQKGNIRKRIKTFKIDNAEIPITIERNILFDILKFKFKNIELINEYFDNIKNN